MRTPLFFLPFNTHLFVVGVLFDEIVHEFGTVFAVGLLRGVPVGDGIVRLESARRRISARRIAVPLRRVVSPG